MFFLTRKNLLGAAILLVGFGAYVNIQYNTYLFQVRGLSPHQIGLLSALGAIPSLFTPLLAGWLVDRSPNPRRILIALTALGAVALWALPRLPGHFLPLACGFFLMECVILPISPLTTSILVEKGDSRCQSNFLALRAMGTLGFFLVSLFLSVWSTRERLPQVYLLMALVLLANLPFLFLLSPPKRSEHHEAPSLRDSLALLWRPGLLPIYLIGALASLASNLGQNMLGNLITSPVIGGQARDISRAWSISTFLEMAFMFAGIFFLRRFGLKRMVLLGIFATALRWLWVSQATNLWEVYASQTLHGILVVGLMTGESLCLARLLPSGLQASGLAVAAILNGGVAGILGSSLAGWIWQAWSLQAVYLCAGLVLVLAGALFWWKIPDLEFQEEIPAPLETGADARRKSRIAASEGIPKS